MIKVKISTLKATREDLPDFLKGLDPETLQNLQVSIDPPPIPDVEYWPETDDTPSFDERTYTKGTETLTADAGTKTVSSVFALDAKPLPEINQLCQQVIRAKMDQVLTQDIDIGGGTISNLAELRENRDLLDGSAVSSIFFKSGHRKVTVAQQTTIKNKMKAHHRNAHKRATAILELIKAESTGTAKIAVLDAQADQGWP